MKGTVVGLVLGLGLLAALFAADRYFPRAGLENSPISGSFVGERRIGDWLLVCAPPSPGSHVPIPFSLSPGSAPPAASRAQLGRCRLSLVMARKGQPGRILLAAHFRLTGQAHALTLILRFPPVGEAGQWVAVHTAGKVFRVPVVSCSQRLCMAGGRIGQPIETLLSQESPAQLVLPAIKGAKPLVLPLPLKGLRDAIAGLRQAENQTGAKG